jgi:hypothetical protein
MAIPFFTVTIPTFDKEGNETGTKTRRYRLEGNALADFKSIVGKDLLQVLPKFDEGGNQLTEGDLGIFEIRALIFVGFRWEDRSYKLEDAGYLLSTMPMDEIMKFVRPALQSAFPKKETKEGESEASGKS